MILETEQCLVFKLYVSVIFLEIIAQGSITDNRTQSRKLKNKGMTCWIIRMVRQCAAVTKRPSNFYKTAKVYFSFTLWDHHGLMGIPFCGILIPSNGATTFWSMAISHGGERCLLFSFHQLSQGT